MDRLVVAGRGRTLLGLAAGCLLALGCAREPVAEPVPTYALESAPATVDAGPPGCERIHERILRAEDRRSTGAGTWLDAPDRMVESRRLRVLHARAAAMGCPIPRI